MEIVRPSCEETMFPEYSNKTLKILCSLHDGLKELYLFCLNYEAYVALLVFIVNFFHFIVLTRKSMRSSSINWIMAATAITDMISQLWPLFWGLAQIFAFFYPCYSKKTAYLIYFLDNLFTAIDSFSRRCTTWLSLSMAFIRTLVIRNPLKLHYDNLTKPKAAFIVVVIVGIACLPLGIMNYFWRAIIEEEGVEECTGNGTSGFEYYTETSAWFADNDMLVYNIYYYLEGVFFKIIQPVQSIHSGATSAVFSKNASPPVTRTQF
ncbi:hypothetical protein L3Y34_006477 [Caenorhabditis briggsae]|uniref:G-protein coupled receptors family 1 profile domain-containing protein n=1 Tax=Caenorhabditis briggsae TaxID=6238 RepID=A0AAE9A433_CAEBR|nr:hypothetical protein L3Y34_006477 [Caenorhabditis briggsae]